MTETITNRVFPYGTFPLDPVFCERYAQDYSRAYYYSLPDRLPHHHPLLKRLEGTYPLDYVLPPWWHACIAQVEPDAVKSLLLTSSAREFRAGCIDQSRWKAFRESLAEEERHQLPNSPKIAALVEKTDWSTQFKNRGPADTEDQLNLVISTHPLDFLYMSNGREWRSCQHYHDGNENERLPGNFYDTGVAVAIVLAPDTKVGDEASVLARTTLRVFSESGRAVVAIGRTYHNNETLAFLLLCKLAHLLDSQYLSWSFMTEVNTLFYCQEGALGPDLCQRIEQEVGVTSEPWWLPHSWYVPYVDGGNKEWCPDWEHETDDYYSMQLNATIMLMRPHAQFHILAQTRDTLTRLASVDMLPCFL